MREMTTRERKAQTEEIVGILRRGAVYVDKASGHVLLSRGYGSARRKYITLKPVEAAYLLFAGKLAIQDDKGDEISFEEFMRRLSLTDPKLTPKFLIYRDLREKGYVVREGYGEEIDFLVYDRGDFPEKPAKFRVIGVDEGIPIRIGKLLDILEFTMLNKKELKLAVIERRGEVVYYTLEKFSKGGLDEEG